MIEYNYNTACIATAEEMASYYDAESLSYNIGENAELLARFEESAELLINHIIPLFFTVENGITTVYTACGSIAPSDSGNTVYFTTAATTMVYNDGVIEPV